MQTLRDIRVRPSNLLWAFFVAFVVVFGGFLSGLQAQAATTSQVDAYHYVFISGYKNEELKGYMTENVRVMRELGATEVDEIRPPSETAILENAEMIHARLFAIASNKPFVLIAHSKGGVETLHAVLKHAADYPASRLAKVVIVQSPLQGSPYTDYVMDVWDHSIYAFTPAYWFFRSQHAGFLSMQTTNVTADFRETLARVSPADLTSILKRVSYLRSKKDFAALPVGLKNSGEVLKRFGDNDGLVPTTHMIFRASSAAPPEFGQDLGVINNFDHLDGFVAGEGLAKKNQVEKFTKLLSKLIFGESLPPGWTAN